MASFTTLLRRVEAHLGQRRRFEHSVRVARCAEALARRHGVDTTQARLAGLFHDLARLYTPEQLLREAEARGFVVAPHERAHPMLLHARLGAALARERFGVEDANVLSAIEKHTTAAGDMSRLDCVVYLADSLEPKRTFPERAELWDLAMCDLDEAMLQVLLLALKHHARGARPAAPETLDAIARFERAEARASAS
jgi:predicted HD superfamily hydrolase involved in NAD metabolism